MKKVINTTWSEYEINILETHYNEYGSEYISNIINRSRTAINAMASKLSIKSNFKIVFATKDDLLKSVENTTSYSDALRFLGKIINGANIAIFKKYCNEYNIIINWKKCNKKNTPKTIEEWLINGSMIGSSNLKERLYKEGLKERKCEKCGQGEEWNGEHMSLILDHINGINDDNRLENLRIVCPNCNATLPTHCRGNLEKRKKENVKRELNKKRYYCECGKEMLKKSKKCLNCSKDEQRKVEDRPTYNQLIKEIEETSYTLVGRKYGVSDNAVRNWIKNYEKEMNITDPYIKNSNYKYSGKYSKNNIECKCGNTKKPESIMCRVCYRKEQDKNLNKPSYDQLIIDIHNLGQTKTSKKYNVSRMAIRRWIEKYEKDINNI